MARLCQSYWSPLYAFVRRQGFAAHEAEDLTQEFFANLLSKDFLANVGPEKGRFRSFLLACMRHFLANERDYRRAAKRGGGRPPISIDAAKAESNYSLEPAHRLTPERDYERRWALKLIEQAITDLADEMRDAGKSDAFERLRVYLAGDRGGPPYAEAAQAMGSTEGAVKVAVHRLRKRLGEILRAEVGRLVDDPADVDDELRRLHDALGA
jgi:RNA polymerase sigma-70 factor (ECF subfamily)